MCSSRFTGVHSEVACKIYSLSLSRVRQRGLREKVPEGLERQTSVRKEWEGRGIQGRSGKAGRCEEGLEIQANVREGSGM